MHHAWVTGTHLSWTGKLKELKIKIGADAGLQTLLTDFKCVD
jgi:hypothetical protein